MTTRSHNNVQEKYEQFREDLLNGEVNQNQIARELGIARQAVSEYIKRNWKL